MVEFKRLLTPHLIALFLIVTVLVSAETGRFILGWMALAALAIGMVAMGCRIIKRG